MGLPKFLERNTGLRSAKECFHILFRQAEHRSTVTLGVFISGTRNAGCEKFRVRMFGGRTLKA